MNMIEIERALRELRLSGIAETLSTRVMQAQAAQEPFLETFGAMLQDELDRRRSDARYLEADTEFARYALASDSERTELLKDWVSPDLIILDDLFLARRISEHAAEVLQAIVHQRYKLRRSIVITSNRVVQDWGKYLGDATMATTILDRLMHRCAMLEFEGKSYRLKEAAARIAITPESS
ncbi:ATP-binding protein [Polaromonas sp. 17-63-33]|uniref:ATP-binding protein n=1 Tax=Polaromonas sp. 17-63-33 TaxID=1970413 RepID=UPI000BC87556|nr:ATP-binding protein [Polaromonas sp. 17-63-33]OZA47792.1 MAG: hypothetical protein B7X88_20600 [Polaromonas sp. 17-63-33]